MVKLFQGRQRSLFGEILDWMLTPFLLLWPITFGLTWLVAEGIAKVPFDRSLQQNVNVLAQLVQSDDQHVSFQLPATAHQILHADATDTVYYQVLGAHSELLGGDADLPPPQDDEKLVTDELRVRDDTLNGAPIRVAYMWSTRDVGTLDRHKHARHWCKSLKLWKSARCWREKSSVA